MPSHDDEILEIIIKKIGQEPTVVERDDLGNIVELNFSSSEVKSLPPEMGLLTNLRRLYLRTIHLMSLPPELGLLMNLERLYLDGNQLTSLPAEIGSLTNLQELVLYGNRLTSLPPEIGLLVNLSILDLDVNFLSSLPPEIGSLTHLEQLTVFGNEFMNLPGEISLLRSLKSLDLGANRLESLPQSVTTLKSLQSLNLRSNRLTSLPPEVSSLTSLRFLELSCNLLTSLPAELSKLTKLEILVVEDNPHLNEPPPEVVKQGTKAILEYLRGLKGEGEEKQYQAKLIVVGEGDTGKTCTLHRIRCDSFAADMGSTEGIDISPLDVQHPTEAGVAMRLATWDFGGQHVYHATHQLFLTKRSLYLLCWNARKDPDQCKLDYWLRTIGSLAPNAPVLLVATHIDERAPDINYQKHLDKYPQLVGNYAVSNKTGGGIDNLREAIQKAAARLPQMGEPWPKNHVAAREEIVELGKSIHHISRDEFVNICGRHRITGDAVNHFASILHDLGCILYFHQDSGLDDMVILQPEWITKAISKVLTDEVTRDKHKGVLDHSDLARIWSEYDLTLHPAFLRLMEKFDLSYRLTDQNASVVAQLLPYEPPVYEWSDVQTLPASQKQLAMDFRLNFVPAGVMTWFIVRTHRFSITDMHWRDGVYLEHDGHCARAELDSERRVFRLEVRGPVPAYFYSLLKDSVDRILERFPGLEVERNIPCICHEIAKVPKHCPWQFSFRNLVERQEKGLETAECQVSFLPVPTARLLYGIHPSTIDQVLKELQESRQETRTRFDQLADLNTRNFLCLWNLELAKLEADCPSLLTISPMDRGVLNKTTMFTKTYDVHLWCQMPGHVHPLVDGSYELKQHQDWLTRLRPWLSGVLTTLRFVIPAASSVADGLKSGELWALCEGKLDAMDRLADLLPEHVVDDGLGDLHWKARLNLPPVHPEVFERLPFGGMDLRLIYNLLHHLDPEHKWGGLRKTISPEGDILWLCPEHYKIFDPGLPTLEDLQGRKK